MLRENRGPGAHTPPFHTSITYPLSLATTAAFVARLGWCRPEWSFCSLPGLEVTVSNYISVEEGSGCPPVPVPAFLWPAREMSPSAQILPSLGGANEGGSLQ